MAAPPKGSAVERELVAAALRDGLQAAHGLGDDLRPDAVAGQHGDARLHCLCRCS